MKIKYVIIFILSMLFLGSCASTPYNPSKPEMSVPESDTYKMPPRTFNQFHKDWDY